MEFYNYVAEVEPRKSLDTNEIHYDDDGNIYFASITGYTTQVKQYTKDIKSPHRVNISMQVFNISGQYDAFIGTTTEKDVSNLVIVRKNQVFMGSDSERMFGVMFGKTKEERADELYNIIYESTAIPILKEWCEYIYEMLAVENYIKPTQTIGEDTHKLFYINVIPTKIIKIISSGLKEKCISIKGTTEPSENILSVDGLDSYLNTFSDILIKKIKKEFKPKFNPDTDEYSPLLNDYDDFVFANTGKQLFKVQKNIIQATINNFKKEKFTLINLEMGGGKTVSSLGAVYAHKKPFGNNIVVMCPTHLINNWKNEIKDFMPKQKTFVVRNLSDLKNLDELIKDKNKDYNLFIIMSKEIAKMNYQEYPTVMYSKHKHAYICPHCYQKVVKKLKKSQKELTDIDFMVQNSSNSYCSNCKEKLWQPLVKGTNERFVKLGEKGWILKSRIKDFKKELEIERDNAKENGSPFEKRKKDILKALDEAVNYYNKNGNFKSIEIAPRKVALGDYINKYYKGVIDYFIADEIQSLKGGNTEQGKAFGSLCSAANYVIGLTGTLLNGYADSIFYLIYRGAPKAMLNNGFSYHSETTFFKEYGTFKDIKIIESQPNGKVKVSNKPTKKMAGVSPLVFSKFLLNNVVFGSLSEMSDALPNYKEIPISVELEPEIQEAYEDLTNQFLEVGKQARESNSARIVLGKMLSMLNNYVDRPYDHSPIMNPDKEDETIISPKNFENKTYAKENKAIELIKEKIENDENVLVYYEYKNMKPVMERMIDTLKRHGIKSALLEANTVSSENREEWLKKKRAEGVRVVFTNPQLIETGLNLIDFTTIIFYQLGYSINTMRQASRRSMRLNQTKDIEVYFLYYERTVQETALSLMATKLKAALAIEGNFGEEGLRAMSENESLLAEITSNVANNIRKKVEANSMTTHIKKTIVSDEQLTRKRKTKEEILRNIEQLYYSMRKSRIKVIKKEIIVPKLESITNTITSNGRKLFSLINQVLRA